MDPFNEPTLSSFDDLSMLIFCINIFLIISFTTFGYFNFLVREKSVHRTAVFCSLAGHTCPHPQEAAGPLGFLAVRLECTVYSVQCCVQCI